MREGFASFEPQAPAFNSRTGKTLPPLMPEAPAEETKVQEAAVPFAADTGQHGEVQEIELAAQFLTPIRPIRDYGRCTPKRNRR